MIRMGIIGVGFQGEDHIKGLLAAGARIEAVAEPRAERRAEIQQRYEIARGYASAEEMFAQGGLDAVGICTPNYLHCAQTVLALENGLHVLCEKPMAMNAAECLEMIQAEQKSGKILMPAFNQLFDWGIESIIRLQREGALGEVYHARTTQVRMMGAHSSREPGSWFRNRKQAGAGVAFDLGAHAIYRAWFCMGRPTPVSVTGIAVGKIIDGDVDDFSACLIRFANGATMMVEVGWETNRTDGGKRTLIMGTKAGAEFIKEDGNGGMERLTLVERTGLDAVAHELPSEKSLESTKYKHFVECLEQGRAPRCTSHDGYVIQAILDALVRSSATSTEEPVSLDLAVEANS